MLSRRTLRWRLAPPLPRPLPPLPRPDMLARLLVVARSSSVVFRLAARALAEFCVAAGFVRQARKKDASRAKRKHGLVRLVVLPPFAHFFSCCCSSRPRRSAWPLPGAPWPNWSRASLRAHTLSRAAVVDSPLSPLQQLPWHAQSRPRASPPAARRRASSWPPRPRASPRPPLAASRSRTGAPVFWRALGLSASLPLRTGLLVCLRPQLCSERYQLASPRSAIFCVRIWGCVKELSALTWGAMQPHAF